MRIFQNYNNAVFVYFSPNLIQNEQCYHYSDNKIEYCIFLYLRGQ